MLWFIAFVISLGIWTFRKEVQAKPIAVIGVGFVPF